MSLSTLIADTRKAVGDDASNAQAVFTAQGTLVGITEVDVKTGTHTDSLSVRLEGDLDIRGFFGFDDTVRPGFSAIRVEVTVTGPESAERYQELAAAVDAHCPVLDLFANPVPVTRTLHPHAPPGQLTGGSSWGCSPWTARGRPRRADPGRRPGLSRRGLVE